MSLYDIPPLSKKLWQHDETGRLCWFTVDTIPGLKWHEVPTMYEDDLPEMTQREYDKWFESSAIVDGVRMGPRV